MRFTEFKEPDALQLTEQQQIVLDYCQGNITKEHAVQLLSREFIAEAPKTFGQAFAQARKAHGGPGGMFTWNGKQYQTNIKGEPYVKNPTPVKFKQEKPPVRPPVDAGDNVDDDPVRPPVDAGDNVDDDPDPDFEIDPIDPGMPDGEIDPDFEIDPIDPGMPDGEIDPDFEIDPGRPPRPGPVLPPKVIDPGFAVGPDDDGKPPKVIDPGFEIDPKALDKRPNTIDPGFEIDPKALDKRPLRPSEPKPGDKLPLTRAEMDPETAKRFKDMMKNFRYEIDDTGIKKYNIPGKLKRIPRKPKNI